MNVHLHQKSSYNSTGCIEWKIYQNKSVGLKSHDALDVNLDMASYALQKYHNTVMASSGTEYCHCTHKNAW